MKKLDHPNIIKLYEIIDDPNSEKLYLIMPVADYGESIEWDPSYTPPSFAALGASGSLMVGDLWMPKNKLKTKDPSIFIQIIDFKQETLIRKRRPASKTLYFMMKSK